MSWFLFGMSFAANLIFAIREINDVLARRRSARIAADIERARLIIKAEKRST